MAVYSYRNGDTSKDYANFMSLLGFKLDEKSQSYYVREKGLFASKRAFISMGFGQGTNIATENAYKLTVDILSENQDYLIKYLASSPETTDNKVVAQIKNIKNDLKNQIYWYDGTLKKEASVKDICSVLNVLTKNPEYKKVVTNCTNHNSKVLKRAEFAKEFEIAKVLTKRK